MAYIPLDIPFRPIPPFGEIMSYPFNKSEHSTAVCSTTIWAFALVVLCGCRSISNDPAPTVYPSQSPEFSPSAQMSSQPPASLFDSPASTTPTAVSEERIQSFRPIIPPSAVSQPSPVLPQPNSAAPLPSPPQISQPQIDELNGRITVLEKALAEKEEQLRIAQLPKPLSASSSFPVQPLPAPNAEQPNGTNVQKPIQQPAEQQMQTSPQPMRQIKPMPVLGIPGVLVSTHPEREEVRIQIPDAVLFVPGTWQISPTAEESLRKIVGEIRANYPEASLDIEGHTDNVNNDPTNKTQKHDIASYKSMVLMQYFVKTLAWDAAKIKSSCHGPSRPIADNGTLEGRNRNNRIEIVVSP